MITVQRSEQEVQRLVSDNRSLVEWSVNRFLAGHVVNGAERDDLVSWGLMGLLSAARAFDEGRGLRFSTLAALSIERSIIRGAMRAGHRVAPGSQVLSLDEVLAEGGAGESETRWVEMIADEGAERDLDRTEQMALLRGAMERLRPEQRRLIQAHFFQGYSLADLARLWGTSRQAVAGQLRRTLKSLRRSLEPARQELC
jgi:RNA polymerase sporulation-specific sigma factor